MGPSLLLYLNPPTPFILFFRLVTVGLTALQFISPSVTLINNNRHIFFVYFCFQQFPAHPFLLHRLHPLILSVEWSPCIWWSLSQHPASHKDCYKNYWFIFFNFTTINWCIPNRTSPLFKECCPTSLGMRYRKNLTLVKSVCETPLTVLLWARPTCVPRLNTYHNWPVK